MCLVLFFFGEYAKGFAFVYSRNISVPNSGNTVIHLDQALARMREYERMKTETESHSNMRCTCRVIEDEDGAAAAATVSNSEGISLVWSKVIIRVANKNSEVNSNSTI